jgi:hypothetical protein
MVGVTTVALLARRMDITRDLFSRYWRDVHGVMAARIPGFQSYIQHHVTPLFDVEWRDPEGFEGIAVVTFAKPQDRDGLIHSPITKHIHRDERNVFRRAMLYNLEAGASTQRGNGGEADPRARFFIAVPERAALSPAELVAMLESDGLVSLASHDLTSGDPSSWNDTDMSTPLRRFVALIQAEWSDTLRAWTCLRRCVAAMNDDLPLFSIEASYAMVEGGRPTSLGLRGLDAVRTIHEAGAVNQLEDAVVATIYKTVNAM